MLFRRSDRVVTLGLTTSLVLLAGLTALPGSPAERPAAGAPSAGAPDAAAGSLPVVEPSPTPSGSSQPTPAPTPQPRTTLREGVVGSIRELTPVTLGSRAERLVGGLVFSGLVRLGPGNRYLPDLASTWQVSSDGRTWTFTIREDARWHDGLPVTSADVLATVRVMRGVGSSATASGAWADVTVAAVDNRTVRFTLATPVAGVLEAATQPLLPAHLVDAVSPADIGSTSYARAPVGTGPYRVVSIDSTAAVLERPTVGVGSEAPRRIEVRFYDTPDALAAAFRSGEVDAAEGLPPSTRSTAMAAEVTAVSYPTTTLTSVVLNLRPDHPELRTAAVRQALLAGIDRARIVGEALGGDARVAATLVPPESWAFDARGAGSTAFSRKVAATGLSRATWTRAKDGWHAPKAKKPFAIELLVPDMASNPTLGAVGAQVAADWRALGLKVTLVSLPPVDLVARVRGGQFDAAVIDIGFGIEPDLYGLLASSQATSRGGNIAGLQDPAIDKLLIDARRPAPTADREAAWRALEAALASSVPLLPIAWRDDVVLQRGIAGVSPRLVSSPGGRFWDVLAWRLAAGR